MLASILELLGHDGGEISAISDSSSVLNLNDTVVAVTRAHEPYLQIVAIAVLSIVIVLLLSIALLWFKPRPRTSAVR